MKILVNILLSVLLIVACLSTFYKDSRRYNFEGEWTWTNGTDSIWVNLKKGKKILLRTNPVNTFGNMVIGTYNLYRNGSLITGNYEEQMLYGLWSESDVLNINVYDKPSPNNSEGFHVRLLFLNQNELKWELGTKLQGGVRFRFPSDPPFPKPIPGFKLPHDIVLTRLK